MRNLVLIAVTFVLCSCSTINYQSGYYANDSAKVSYNHTFTDKFQLPYRLIISDQYLSESSRLFLINQDWIGDYSKFIEYDISTSSIVNEIISFDGDNQQISEYCNNDSCIVFVVSKEDETHTLKDIYLYDIHDEELRIIKSEIICSLKKNYSNDLFISINENSIIWLNPDLEGEKSEIVEYNIESNTFSVIHQQPHLNIEFMKHVPIKYLNVLDDFLVFNVRTNSGNEKIVIYDLSNQTMLKEVNLPTNCERTYNAVFDKKDDLLYIYGKLGDEEVIYKFDYRTDKTQNLIGIYPHTNLYKDKLTIQNNYLLYTIQQQYSGYIQDHYFSEIYDLKSFQMLRYQYVFNIVETNNYFGFLKFDKEEGANKIDLELYKKN